MITGATARAARHVQVNIPYRMLHTMDDLRALFLSCNLNPELGMDLPALGTYTNQHFRDTAQMLGDAGSRLTFHGPFEGIDLGSPRASVRQESMQHMERLLEVAIIMKPETVVCHTGYLPGVSDAHWVERSQKPWGDFFQRFSKAGVHLLLENVHEESAQVMHEITGSIDGVRYCLDTGHLNAYGDGDLSSWLRILGEETLGVHLHDNHGKEDEHLPPGAGNIDFSPLLAWMTRHPLVVTLEPHTPDALWPALEFVATHMQCGFKKGPTCPGGP